VLKKGILYTTLFALLFSAELLFAQTSYIEHYDVKDGLPSNTCFFSLQDSKGYIWVGTDAGVSRFDGKYFRNFSIDDGLPDNQILQIKEDKAGRIWFLSFSGKLSYFQDGKIYNKSNSNLLRKLNITEIIVSFFEDGQGRLWFGSNKNLLYLYDGDKLLKFSSRELNKQFLNACVYEDAQQNIWVINQRAVMLYKNGSFYHVSSIPNTISYKTLGINADGNLLFLDAQGLKLLDKRVRSIDLKIPLGMLNNKLGFIHATTTELWLSNNEGVFMYEKGKPSKQYLHNIPASQVIKDKSQNTWFTTANGIYMLPREENRMYIINQQQGLSSNYIKSIAKDKHYRLWLGLDKGIINVLDENEKSIQSIKLGALGIKSNIKQLHLDSIHESLYFSSDLGIGRINNIYGNKQPELLREVTSSVVAMKHFSLSPKNKLAIASASGVFSIDNPLEEFQFHALKVKHGENFYSGRAYSVHFDIAGVLWFSNVDGLNSVGGKGLSSTEDIEYFREKRINDIKTLENGMLVLATDGYGLAYVQGGKIIKKITVKDGLADNICKKLFVDGNHLWVITNNGINNVCIDGPKVEVQGFEYTNALLKNDVNDLYIGKKTAYFATNNGLIYFPKIGFIKKKKAPRVIVSGILNNNSNLTVADTLQSLDPSKNNITFIFSSIDFQKQDLLYRFRLKPEDSWTETRNRRLEFSSLSPGNYTFEISAKSNNTDWSDTTKINFKLEEHFWQRNWFILVLLIAASFTFYKIAVIITKWQKNQEQKQLMLKHKILILEQRALLAMMNPHFIFNVMNSVQHYINTKDTSSANKILTGFARLIRKNLEICTKSFICLEEELEYLNLYLGLEKKRFGEKFNYSISIDSDIDKEEIFIPSMLLQPYIENAIWHGIMPKEEGGNIDISMKVIDQEYLLINVIDDGVGIENSQRLKKEHHSSKGMSLTQERVQLLNQIESISIQIDINQQGDSGTIVTIQIPI
jgi:ligand-binding sensor domain-containing protein